MQSCAFLRLFPDGRRVPVFGHWIGLEPNYPDFCPDRSECVLEERTTREQYSCEGCRHRWEWLDGTPNDVYDNWTPGNPVERPTLNTRSRCVVYDKRAFDVGFGPRWRNTYCTTRSGYICKKGWFGLFYEIINDTEIILAWSLL